MKYKVGDKVRIKSLGWYDENKDVYGYIECGKSSMNFETSQLCGKIVTISRINDATNTYRIEEDNGLFFWTDEMFEGLVEEETKTLTTEKMDKVIEEAKTYWDSIKDAWICPNGYIFKDENGNVINARKIVLEKKKKEYPNTYEECCKIIGIKLSDCYIQGYKSPLLEDLQELLICRDAYWKIAGEEMGLGKPWEPNWKNSEERRYSIVNIEGDINLPEKILTKWILKVTNKILVFPTEEMRDAFYENFKELIESCKELL